MYSNEIITELPKIHSNNINWKQTVGMEIKILFNNKMHIVEILDYNVIKKQHVTIKIDHNYITHTHTNTFLNLSFGKIFKEIGQFKYNINDIVKPNKNGELLILKQCYKKFKNGKKSKAYLYQCLHCANIDTILEGNLKSGKGCNVCSNQKIIPGINDVATTHPHLLKYFVNKNDGNKYSKSSNKKILCKCPICGLEKHIRIVTLNKNGFGCTVCGDGISQAEKFVSNVLNQLFVDFKREVTFEWSRKHITNLNGNKRYDFYIKNKNMIIETHGKQHYIANFNYKEARTLKEEQENDRVKERLAKENGIEHYIILDCRKTELKFLKKEIIKKLSCFYDLNLINWRMAYNYMNTSLLRDACSKFNYGLTSYEISKKINICVSSVVQYLKRGTILGFCNYNPKQEQIKCGKRQINKNGYKIVCELNGKKAYFYSFNDAERSNIFNNLTSTIASKVYNSNKPFKPFYKRLNNLSGLIVRKPNIEELKYYN
ncbi:hypothetical protein ACXAT3_002636 [Clostridium sporogenes]